MLKNGRRPVNSLKKRIFDVQREKAEKLAFMECLAEKKKRRKYLSGMQLTEKLAILETLRENANHIRRGLMKSVP